MKYILLIILSLLIAISAFAASINFTSTLPAATSGTLGVNQQLEIQKAALQEIRTKMTNWATFTGYSARGTR